FFEKSKLISDEEMQLLWSRILSEEANFPGTFSKRTLAILSSLDKADAILFQKLCSFCWDICPFPDGEISRVPFIYLPEHQAFYKSRGVAFDQLKHLESIGLINHSGASYFILDGLVPGLEFKYFD